MTMQKWKRLSKARKISLILSLFNNGEELTATEILQRLRDRGVQIDQTPSSFAYWLRLHMEFKHLKRVRKPDPENSGFKSQNRTFWKLI